MRKIAAFDVESTGLSPDSQLLEIAAVVMDANDMTTPVEDLPYFQTLVGQVRIFHGEPKALAMNAGLLDMIAEGHGVGEEQAVVDLATFLQQFCGDDKQPHPLGFNVNRLDRELLLAACEIHGIEYPFHYRSIELGTLLMSKFKSPLPVRSIDALRVVLNKDKQPHRALEDCHDAIHLYRWAMTDILDEEGEGS